MNEITARPQGIWTSLDISYDALQEVERQVFRQTSIFPDAVPDSVIQAVTQVNIFWFQS